MKKLLVPLLLMLLSLTACGGEEATSTGQMDYEQTKKMIVDILKTDEGKKAIQEIMKDDSLKKQLIMDQAVVSETIQQTLTSDKAQEFWKKSFSDPEFTKAVAKSMKTQNKELLKELMKDPEYQGMMLEILNDPEYQKETTELLKSKEYREHLQKVVTETLESPIYKAKIQEILLKAANEQKSGEDQQKQEKGQEGEEQEEDTAGS